jgi:hypothetical protein
MTQDQNRHPDNEVLELYSFGRLPESELECVENHLFVCERCQEELISLECSIREIKEACKTVRRQPEPVRVGLLTRLLGVPGRPVFAGAFAALAVAVVVPLSIHPTGNLAPSLVQLDTMRGAGEAGAAQAPAKRPLHLQLNMPDSPGTPAYRAEIVNQDGSSVWSGSPVRENGTIGMNVEKSLGAGQYWVRLFNQGSMVREFGLVLR